MKSQIELWNSILMEMGMRCQVSTAHDFKTVMSRFEHEGLSFLTITLPSFASDLQKGLDAGKVDHDLFLPFRKKGGLPRFLGGFLDRVFDRGTGLLLDFPCVDSLLALRQLTLMFAKVLVPCSDARNRKAIRGYLECESDIKRNDSYLPPERLERFKRMSLRLFGDELSKLDLAVYRGDLVPKHGPGQTADRLRGNAKFDLTEWTTRLEDVFPYGDYCLPNWRYYYRLDRVDIREPGKERPVRVVLVPKTLKTPRVIAIEPTCMQFMQQALMEPLVELLESSPTIPGVIGFLDQTPNQRMARIGSETGSLATIDLSEASDRVSNQHVRALLSLFPHLSDAVDACRSRKADVPGHGVIRLAKFASMGSALCFPFEAMVFTTLVFMGIEDALGSQLPKSSFRKYKGKVRVYGDDIIVPKDSLPHVINSLESFGLKVNEDKTFGTGKFRESCGRDYYDGFDVTPVRVRHKFPSSRGDVQEVIASVSLRNRLYEAGLWRTAFWLDEQILPLLGGKYPYVGPNSPLLGRVSHVGRDDQRLDPNLHSPQAKGYVVSSTPPLSKVSGEGALLKWFLKRGDEPFADRNHLERSGRPDAVGIKLRWASTY